MLVIYGYDATIQKCIGCESAKRLCLAKKAEFEFKSIADSKDENGQPLFNENFDVVVEKLGRSNFSLPVIFDGDKHIGGFDHLRAHLANK